MSTPAPRRSNLMNTLLLAAVIYLGLTLFIMPGNRTDNRSPEDFKQALAAEVDALRTEAATRGVPSGVIIEEWTRGGRQVQLKQRVGSLSVQDSLAQFRLINEFVLDQTAAAYLPFHQSKVDALIRASVEKPDDADRMRIEGVLLAAHTQFKAGLNRGDFGRLNQAYLTLQGPSKQFAGSKEWTETVFELPASGGRHAFRGTAQEFYDQVVAELNRRSKSDLIMGFIPGYQIIDALVALTGRVPGFSYAFAAFLLAGIVRGMVWPLAQKQYMWGRQMARLQPLVKELQEKYKDKKTGQIKDMQGYQQASMALYKEYGFNPLAGCWPMFIQVPYFLLIYQCMVHYRFEFQNGTFLWINPSLSAATRGWIAPNLGQMDYILIVVYAISMIVTTLLTPVSDPTNARQQRIMGVSIAAIFSVMMFFYPLPSAFVLYWVFTNVFATLQMLRAYRMPLPPLVKVNAPAGGLYPADPSLSNGVPKTGAPVRHKPKKRK